MRDLLLHAEALPLDEDDEFQIGFVDLADQMLGEDPYQLYLMKDAGWIEGRHAEHGMFRITSMGHDYLDATRDRGIWDKTKHAVAAMYGWLPPGKVLVSFWRLVGCGHVYGVEVAA